MKKRIGVILACLSIAIAGFMVVYKGINQPPTITLERVVHGIVEHPADILPLDSGFLISQLFEPELVFVNQEFEMGLNVSDEMPTEILELMDLYPQPVRRHPSVTYLPSRRHAAKEEVETS